MTTYKILVANNSIAAYKFIMSLKKTRHKILFYGLGTKEDLDSLYVQYLTSFELMKSGPSTVNYCKIDLIIRAAKKFKVDYVWPGWGYLAENSMFSKQLKENNIGFIGPDENAMHILGDKWKSTELCNLLCIPTIPCINIAYKSEQITNAINAEEKDYNTIIDKIISKLSLIDKYSLYKQYKKLSEEKKNEIKKIWRYGDCIKNMSETERKIKISEKCFVVLLETFPILQKYHKPASFEKRKKSINFDKITKSNVLESEKDKDLQKCVTSQEKYNIKSLNEFLSTHNFPILLKKSNSGGGKGIREINNMEELYSALDTVESEGLGDLMIVKSIKNAKHIELQMACDSSGNVICLGGRDCTLQRRNQKLLEESLETLDCKFYSQLKESAFKLMNDVKYTGVATVEFLVTSNSFYFLEVNTRIQVEHPVTELKYNVNIPELQFLIAIGQSISKYKFKKSKKHVIGVRIVAENVDENFLPVTGGFSVNSPCFTGCLGYFAKTKGKITEYNDSQFGHVFVKAKTRNKAAQKMIKYLENTQVIGIHTNIRFMIEVLKSNFFITKSYNTQTIESNIQNKKNAVSLKHCVDPVIVFVTIIALEEKKALTLLISCITTQHTQ